MFDRRSFLLSSAGLLVPASAFARPGRPAAPAPLPEGWLDVRHYGAKGDGVTIDGPAINRAIDAASRMGGGTVWFPAGTYASYTIRLKSHITLHLEAGVTLLAAPVPFEGAPTGGYDIAEDVDVGFRSYQDSGHSHWKNSLIYGEGLENIAIEGHGLIHGKGLARDWHDEGQVAGSRKPGVGDKTIALKNCHGVTLRDFSILQGGWFGLLATGVDNLTIDNVTVDTNRDGFDIDCCRNVRVLNCTVNSPWDDGICPKSSFALGYARATENVTIFNCFVTGGYELGSVIAGTWKRMPDSFSGTGRIKCGTESNGGFTNITISNCVFDHSRGLCLETVDGARCEDITISNVTMRGSMNSPLFLRLGRRMRGPLGASVGTLKRVLISNLTSHDAALLPSIIAGVPGNPVEDIQINDVYLHQRGGASAAMAAVQPPEQADQYPEPVMFGDLPATGLFVRHARNISLGNVEFAVDQPDARPAMWMQDVDGVDAFRLRAPKGPVFALDAVSRFRSFGNSGSDDIAWAPAQSRSISW